MVASLVEDIWIREGKSVPYDTKGEARKGVGTTLALLIYITIRRRARTLTGSSDWNDDRRALYFVPAITR